MGPILLGSARAVHILTPALRIGTSACQHHRLAVVDAAEQREELPV